MRLFDFRLLKLVFAAMALPSLIACNSTKNDDAVAGQPTGQSAVPVTAQTAVERGKYLVTVGGCNDCHSPKKYGPQGPEIDTARLLSGHPEEKKIVNAFTPAKGSPWGVATNDDFTAWSGPWGVSFTA